MPVNIEKKVAIMVDDYHRPTQTFCNRHIKELFSGNTVVICNRRTGENIFQKPVYCRSDQKLGWLDILTFLPEQILNLRRFGSTRAPTGKKKRALEEFLRSENVGAILVELAQYGPGIWPIARDLKIPVFVYFRGYDATGYLHSRPNKRNRRIQTLKTMFNNVSGVFAVSQFLLDELRANGLIHPNSHVIPSGVDTHTFSPTQKKTGRVVAAGRFVEKKAPDVTTRTFLRVAQEFPEARLEMIGDGPMLNACKALAASHKLGSQITFSGEQSHEYVKEKLADCEVFMQHSVIGSDGDQEGAPTAIQEAMSCGAAILSTRHAGIPDLVENGKTGFLVDEFDEDAFSDNLRLLLSDRQKTLELGENAREFAVRNLDYRLLYEKVEKTILES